MLKKNIYEFPELCYAYKISLTNDGKNSKCGYSIFQDIARFPFEIAFRSFVHTLNLFTDHPDDWYLVQINKYRCKFIKSLFV